MLTCDTSALKPHVKIKKNRIYVLKIVQIYFSKFDDYFLFVEYIKTIYLPIKKINSKQHSSMC